MNTMENSFKVRHEQGFVVYVLRNQRVEVAVVPELGAKIISLKNLETGREWMWHPPGGPRLFRNHPDDDFSKSPLVGVDECLPTIAPCSWRGRELPDHGELWNTPWSVDHRAWAGGILKTSARLDISPFEFERTIELQDNEIRISYQLNNRSREEEAYLWAMHALLKLHTGDRIELPASTRGLLNGETWIEALDSAVPAGGCAKAFARPLQEGWAAVVSADMADRLEFEWDPAENNTLGLWLTRGGWHGYHHFALEPTNSDADALTAAAGRKCCGLVAASGSAAWRICFRIGR
jgi:hypothetical protein